MPYKFMFFKSPTCGPCKLFYPQVENAAKTLNIELITIDVTEDTETPKKYNIQSSGTLLLLNENNEVIKMWERPCPANNIISEVQSL